MKPHLDPGLSQGHNATNSPKLNREAAAAVLVLGVIWVLAAWLAYAVVTAQ